MRMYEHIDTFTARVKSAIQTFHDGDDSGLTIMLARVDKMQSVATKQAVCMEFAKQALMDADLFQGSTVNDVLALAFTIDTQSAQLMAAICDGDDEDG
jgi:hypothetical protein